MSMTETSRLVTCVHFYSPLPCTPRFTYLLNTSGLPGLPADVVHYNSSMADGTPDSSRDPRWPKLLSLSTHEFRSPLSVIAGYIRMLLKEQAGPLGAQQRRLLEEAEKSCGRLSTLLSELSELSQLESGTAPFNRSTANLRSILAGAVAGLPDLQDRPVAIHVHVDDTLSVHGDAVRLRTAFSSILHALCRELVTCDAMAVHVEAREGNVGRALRISIGEANRIDALGRLEPADLATFDEWRGGNGLRLPNARRIIEAHGGRIWSPTEAGKASAIVELPPAPV